MPRNPDPAHDGLSETAMRDMSLEQWLAWLERLHPSTIDLGLERIREVARRLGLDFGDRRVVTVAGTNGKGSTVTLLDRLLREAGHRTGVYTSPHLLRYNERVRLDGRLAGDAELCEAFVAVERAREGVSLTYFEFGTLAAFWLFARRPLDVLILEVGLGGRLDAVNLADADVSVLTNVAIDHVDWLGATRDAIGREKAGIFRAGKAAVYGELDMPTSVAETASALGAPLYRQGQQFGWSGDPVAGPWHWHGTDADGRKVTLRDLPGCRFAADNVACVLQVLHLLGEQPSVGLLEAGLRDVTLAGRFQRLTLGERVLVLDVAHNPHAARNLATSLRREFPGRRIHLVAAMLGDKDAAGVVDALADAGDDLRWYVGELSGERGASAQMLYNHVRARGEGVATVHGDVLQAFDAADVAAQSGDVIVVTGSFLTVAGVLQHLAESGLDEVDAYQGLR